MNENETIVDLPCESHFPFAVSDPSWIWMDVLQGPEGDAVGAWLEVFVLYGVLVAVGVPVPVGVLDGVFVAVLDPVGVLV